ncbi:MAG: sugar phosphate isomerase/epimerase family protein [Abditibacteriaceae bacterium]
MKLSICNEVFGGEQTVESWRDLCGQMAGIGYQGIELAPFTLTPDVRQCEAKTRKEIKIAAADHGLPITSLHWLLVSPPGLHINAVDDKNRLETVDFLRALIDFAADVGAETMIFGSPKQRAVEDNLESAWQRAVESYSKVLSTLAERGVTLCMESLPAPECDFVMTAAEAAKMVADVNHPNFKLMLDTKSLCGESDDPSGKAAAELIDQWGKQCHYYHANDANRRAPGYGETDFHLIASALKKAGYEGWVSLEPFDYLPDPMTLAKESFAYMKECGF